MPRTLTMIDATRRERGDASLKSVPSPPPGLSPGELIGPSAIATFGAHFCRPRLMVHLHLYCLNFISPHSNNDSASRTFRIRSLSFTAVRTRRGRRARRSLTSRRVNYIPARRARDTSRPFFTSSRGNKTRPQNTADVYAASGARARDFNVDPRTARQYILERGMCTCTHTDVIRTQTRDIHVQVHPAVAICYSESK